MPDERISAVYYLDFARHVPPGRLIHIEDRPGGQADIYFHPLHIREQLVHELNTLTLHQVGNGLWRQRWTHDGRMQQPAKGLDVAHSSWEIIPAREMPRHRCVIPIEDDGSCVWLVKRGYCTVALAAEINQMLQRIAGDGLWRQAWHEEQEVPRAAFSPVRVPSLA